MRADCTSETYNAIILHMQQYFSDRPLAVGDEYIFTKEQAHHARDVVRLDEETVRLVFDGKGYFGTCRRKGNEFVAVIEREDDDDCESAIDVTLACALIRREKFELILQKAAELGVNRIVPFESSRCVVHARSEKAQKQKERWEKILLEAAQQCKRSRIPELTEIVSFKDLPAYRAEVSCAAYEAAGRDAVMLSEAAAGAKSVTAVIGPEGGFAEEEIAALKENGFIPVTLGSRILRAETAAIYVCSILSEMGEKR